MPASVWRGKFLLALAKQRKINNEFSKKNEAFWRCVNPPIMFKNHIQRHVGRIPYKPTNYLLAVTWVALNGCIMCQADIMSFEMSIFFQIKLYTVGGFNPSFQTFLKMDPFLIYIWFFQLEKNQKTSKPRYLKRHVLAFHSASQVASFNFEAHERERS